MGQVHSQECIDCWHYLMSLGTSQQHRHHPPSAPKNQSKNVVSQKDVWHNTNTLEEKYLIETNCIELEM